MAAAKLKLSIEQGATFRKTLTWKTGTPATPVNLTGCAARMQIRSDVASTVVLVDLTVANGGIIMGGVAGTIVIVITDTATSAITWTEGVYDLEVVMATGDVVRLLYGTVTVSPEVTRP